MAGISFGPSNLQHLPCTGGPAKSQPAISCGRLKEKVAAGCTNVLPDRTAPHLHVLPVRLALGLQQHLVHVRPKSTTSAKASSPASCFMATASWCAAPASSIRQPAHEHTGLGHEVRAGVVCIIAAGGGRGR